MANLNPEGLKKIAILIKIVGAPLVMNIIKGFDRETVEHIQDTVDNLPELTKIEAVKAMKEFNSIVDTLAPTDNSVVSLMAEYDDAILSDSPEARQKRRLVGFSQLDEQEVEKIVSIISNESSINKAVIIRQLSARKAQEVMSSITPKEQAAILSASHNSEEPPVEVLEKISAHIEKYIETMITDNPTNYAALVDLATTLSEKSLEALLEEVPENIAADIRANAITFSDVLSQAPKVIQRILGAMDTNTLAFAASRLEGDDLDLVMKNISATKREDVEFALNEVDKSDDKSFEDAQGRVVLSAKNLRDSGDILFVK